MGQVKGPGTLSLLNSTNLVQTMEMLRAFHKQGKEKRNHNLLQGKPADNLHILGAISSPLII